MQVLLAALLLCSPQLPKDPAQATAAKALADTWGPLQPWQSHWYQQIRDDRLTATDRAKVTFYGPFDGGNDWKHYWFPALGKTFKCGPAICAANPEVPRGSIIFIAGVGLRMVGDRGGKVTLRYCRRGETANFDAWNKHDLGTRQQVPFLLLRRGWSKAASPALAVVMP